jgi:catechol 2,3-dioxygenase-like lactoylglutathione lyase family enzyme
MPTVAGVIETALYVDDLERSGRFYGEVFGFRLLMAEDRMRAYSVADKQVLLLFKTGGSAQPSPMHGGVIPPHDGRGMLHLAFAIAPDDLEPWKRRLEDEGVALESQVHCGDDRPQGDSLYFRDPDGHLIELITPGCWEIY